MTRDLILGTAGHIDHGKTALVKALTGTDCDRLPEEKRRGITIDIGFATLDLGDVHLGIVDVPGHERFIRNMLAGATGIDLVMLVVAADDSVMPQTREHLEIVKLLGLKHGLIALTKCDLVDTTTRDVVELEIRELVRGTFLADASLVSTSAHSGQGIAELKATIAATARQVEARAESEWFRMAIDRSFIVQGHGTVVTGSVTSGSVAVGDELEWQPRGETVRVRSLQNHGQAVQRVQRGQRAALNLAGVHHENVIRGQELGAPGYLEPSRTFTVKLNCPANAPRPIKHRASIRFHLGTAEIMGAVSLLDADRIEPGGAGLAQVFLEAPTTAVWGQPFVIRAPSATQTLGGGQVLQPTARKVRRQQPDVLARLAVLATGDEEQRALETAWFAGLNGVTAAELVRGAGLTPATAETALQQLLRRGALAEVHGADHLVHAAVIRDLEDRILKSLARLHAEFPLAAGHERQKLHAELAYLGNGEAIDLALRGLEHRKKIVSDGLLVRRGDFKPTLSNSQARLREKVLAGYREAGVRPPRADSFAPQAGGNAANLNDLLAVCVAEGQLIHLDEDYYVDPTVEAQARQLLTAKLANGAALTVAEIRDILNTGRKHALLFCAYYDRIGFTRRDGDLRKRGKS